MDKEDLELYAKYAEEALLDMCFFAEEFLPHLITSKIPEFHKEIYKLLPDEKRLVIAAPRGFAKAQPLTTNILTPTGWVKLGDLRVGDLVVGSDGKPTKVTHLHPVSEMRFWRITTRDGRSSVCNEDHLWRVTCPSNTGDRVLVKSLKDIRKNYKSDRFDKRNGENYVEYRYFIDFSSPIEFSKKEFYIDPYTLGVWLGDGHSAGQRVTSNDPEIISYLPYKVSKNKGKFNYGVHGINKLLRKYDLINNKHIPEDYFWGSVEQREALLQGLIDTDGHIQKDGHIAEFCNINDTLVNDVVRLVRSLGGTAAVSDGYSYCNGKKFLYKKVLIRVPKEIIPCRLSRKSITWKGSLKTKSAIVDISPCGAGLGRCITVGNKDGIYITEDYLPTHNSTISSVIYPVWLACRGNLRKDICVISASETLAKEMLRRIKRELESNAKIIEFFGGLQTDKWSETHFITSTGVTFRARGAGGQIRGFRPDCLILDDIETDELVESEEQRKKLKDWLFKACLNTLLPHGQLVVVGSIIHPLSVLSDLLLIDNGWTKRKYQAYKDAIQEPGKELWPDLWPHEKLQERKREIGSFAFSSEFLNDPISDETAPIKEHHIRYWKDLPEQMSYVVSVDPAYSEDEKADYKIAALIGIDSQLNRYLVTYVRTHSPTGEFMDSILNLWMQNRGKCTGIGIPGSGTEKEFFRNFIEKANQRKVYPPVIELKNVFNTQGGIPKRAKKARIIAALQPLFEAGKYFIHQSHHEAREELLTIGSSRWDDLVDAMAYAEQILTPVFMDSPQGDSYQPTTRKIISTYGYEI